MFNVYVTLSSLNCNDAVDGKSQEVWVKLGTVRDMTRRNSNACSLLLMLVMQLKSQEKGN